MTLNTSVYVLDEIDLREVFEFAKNLIGARPDYAEHERGSYVLDDGVRVLEGLPGQGYPAWLSVAYRPGGKLREVSEDGFGPCWLDASFDTGYAYRDEQGRDCGALHAEYVARLGRWLDERGIRWEWLNEFTGEVHTGYDRLVDMIESSGKARDWFLEQALPAIMSEKIATARARVSEEGGY